MLALRDAVDRSLALAFLIVQNLQRFEDLFYAAFEEAARDGRVHEGVVYTHSATSMMFRYLFDQEETILRCDWRISRGQADEHCDVMVERARYARMRAKLETAVNWRAAYDAAKKDHNLEMREGLEDSDGQSVHFVLPEFNADGTHEAWGPWDVPWAV